MYEVRLADEGSLGSLMDVDGYKAQLS